MSQTARFWSGFVLAKSTLVGAWVLAQLHAPWALSMTLLGLYVTVNVALFHLWGRANKKGNGAT